MDTVKAIVPSGFWPRAKDVAAKKAIKKTTARDLFFISIGLVISHLLEA
jgi:hypothetical protein